MNKRDNDILLAIATHGYTHQRTLAEHCCCSLGAVNASVKNLLAEGFIDSDIALTEKSTALLEQNQAKRAIILAAGAGMRMFPTNTEKPKALLKIQGEALIERIINQLHQAEITEIYVVAGFAKEQFEYLIDKYGVELIINSQYSKRNNLHSLWLAKGHLQNCFIIPADLWCKTNLFAKEQIQSWYMVSDEMDVESSVRINRKQELVTVHPADEGNHMVGISYLTKDDADTVCARLCDMNIDRRYEGAFWEEALYQDDKMTVAPRLVSSKLVAEINTFEDLQEMDSHNLLPLDKIAKQLGVGEVEIENIAVLKKGSTNRSYSFVCKGEKYILRINGDTAYDIINHKGEADAYSALCGKGIADEIVFIDRQSGLKISKHISDIRFCNPFDENDVATCMKKLKEFHALSLTVEHKFDLFDTINQLEGLWGGEPSVYTDYHKTKENVFSLANYIEKQDKQLCLTHIDAVADNFLISKDSTDWRDVRIIDWEYAAMQDPHLDVAMFCLYALYNRQQTDRLIDIYFDGNCPKATRIKIYCYMSVAGLLWSNWCEYKHKNGMEFGEYSLRQYRYAKDYYNIVANEIDKTDEMKEK